MENKKIRKTAFMMFKHCEKQFEYFFFRDPDYDAYVQPVVDDRSPTGKGHIFHVGCDDFFPKIDLEEMRRLDSEQDLIKYIRTRLPDNERIDDWFDYFAEFEARRFIMAKTAYEKELDKVYMPVATELYVNLPGEYPRTGHVDRLDYLPAEKALCVVEYKTGRSYDLSKDRTLTSLRAETGWYAIILNKLKMYDLPVTHWACINPMLKQYHVERFHSMSLKAVENQYNKLVKKIKAKGPFEKNLSPLCGWCKYSNDCLYSFGEGDFDLNGL